MILELKRIEKYYTLDGELVEENDTIPVEYVVREELHGEDRTITETLEEAQQFLKGNNHER